MTVVESMTAVQEVPVEVPVLGREAGFSRDIALGRRAGPAPDPA